jgi:hypothetical protein
MTTKEIKSFLHEKIDNIEDSNFLQTIKEILSDRDISIKAADPEDWQLKRMKDADTSISRGEFITDKDARDIINNWLKR